LKAFVRDEHGATAIEYALIVSFIAVVIVASLGTIAPVLNSIFNEITPNLAVGG